MSAKSIFVVWRIVMSLALPDGQQEATMYTSRPIESLTPLVVNSVGKNQEHEAGYCMGVIEGFTGVNDDPKHIRDEVEHHPTPGWNMVLTDGSFDKVGPRTYTLIVDHALTKSTVTVSLYGYTDHNFDGFVMPFKTYPTPFDVPGGPKRPEPESEFYH